MTKEQFESRSKELESIAGEIPIGWCKVQNDKDDKKVDIFKIDDYDSLKKKIANIKDEKLKTYIRRRWFLWQCARCDEYLFCSTGYAEHNPNVKSKKFDVIFLKDKRLMFDLKGTRAPKTFWEKGIKSLLNEPKGLVKWLYDSQSKGVRDGVQNRLFIIHHSKVNYKRETYVRTAWESKQQVYSDYVSKLRNGKRLIDIYGVKADLIFLVEEKDRTIKYYFYE